MTDNDKAAKQKATDEWFETHKSTPDNYDDEAARMDMLLLLAFGDGYDTAEAQHAERVKVLVDVIESAIEVIHTWHGDVAWDIYKNNAPEMKPLIEALAEHRTESENG